MADQPEVRAYVGRYFALSFDDGEPAGFLKGFDGGNAKGELLAQQVGGQPQRSKHILNPSIEPFSVQVGMSMSDAFWEWIRKSWAGEITRKSGSIITYDFKRKPMHEAQFTEALILETTIPTLDATSRDAAYMTVKFQSETMSHNNSPSGEAPKALTPSEQKLWHPSNFRFEIEGLNTRGVAKIDSFTVKQNVKPMACGSDWMYQIEPTSLEFPNLTIYLAMSYAGDFVDWHKQFVIDGQNGPDKEKTGAIVFTDPTRTKDLLTISLSAVGIVSIVPEKLDQGQDQIRRAKVELYCEEMGFEYKGGSAA